MEVCKKVANVVALSSQDRYEHRLKQLQALQEAWGENEEMDSENNLHAPEVLLGMNDTCTALQLPPPFVNKSL